MLVKKIAFTTLFSLNFLFLQFVCAQIVEKEYTRLEEALKEPNKVIRLNLENQNINDSLKEIAKFKNLKYLNLRNTHQIGRAHV